MNDRDDYYLQNFQSNETIDNIRNNRGVRKQDIKKAARDLLGQIAEHPSMLVNSFFADPDDLAERKRTLKIRKIAGDAFGGGFGGSTSMLNAYNELCEV